MSQKIVLASQSPRRKQLLGMLGLDFSVCAADIDETPPPGMDLRLVAEYLALEKAKVIAPQQPDALIIAADTLVLLEGNILGKPESAADAVRMLHQLSGKMHEVISGVAVIKKSRVVSFQNTTEVYFKTLSDAQIAHYVHSHQPLDKAGAYAIQEYIGLVGIEKIVGDYYNVMGLPVSALVDVLVGMGIEV